jgi:HAD superfamily hydrolase (TIGR01509 family)
LIEAVIFDLDGVIVDSEQAWNRVRRSFVERHGGAWREDSSRHMMGLSTREWIRYLTTELGVELSDEEVANQMIEELKLDYGQHVPLIPGAATVVRQLSADWPLAVASGSPMSLIEAVLEGGSIRGVFQVVVSSDEVAAGKPAPDVYLEAARRLNVSVRRCAVVEDSSNGIKSASVAGAKVIAIPNAVYPPDCEVLSLASVVLADIRSLTAEVVRDTTSAGGRH